MSDYDAIGEMAVEWIAAYAIAKVRKTERAMTFTICGELGLHRACHPETEKMVWMPLFEQRTPEQQAAVIRCDKAHAIFRLASSKAANRKGVMTKRAKPYVFAVNPDEVLSYEYRACMQRGKERCAGDEPA